MSQRRRPWLPTSTRETALVFGLNLMLMVHFVVIALLVTGDLLPAPVHAMETRAGGQDRSEIAGASNTEAVLTEHLHADTVDPQDGAQLANDPQWIQASASRAAQDAQPLDEPKAQQKPSEDEPATLFGVPLR